MKTNVLATAVLACFSASVALAQEKVVAPQFSAFSATKSVGTSKLDFHLQQKMIQASARQSTKSRSFEPNAQSAFVPHTPETGDYVTVDVTAEGSSQELLQQLQQQGLRNGAAYGRIVSGYFPVANLSQLEQMDGIRVARQSLSTNNVGAVTSRGGPAMNADTAKSLTGLTGAGVRIGVISDTFNANPTAATTAADDLASGDLPADIIVLEDSLTGTDEGRGMMQLIHDVAPGASQAFHTANGGQANFATGIVELDLIANSDVIVDDIIYLAEPMFQDGIIAQAVDIVESRGVPYFSSAGNNGRDAWESTRKGFQDSGVTGIYGGARHDFDKSRKGVDDLLNISIGPGVTFTMIFQWADPFFSVSGAPGAASDVDMVAYTPDGQFVIAVSDLVNIGGDPIEGLSLTNGGPVPAEFALGLELFAGPEPGLMKWVAFANGSIDVLDFPTNSGTVYGHANAAGAIAVGASAWFNTPNFNPNVETAFLESFSSAGPTKILFDRNGSPTNQKRRRPDFVGPDGTNTTFFGSDLPFAIPDTDEPDGFPNFFGTSASAPHAAAVAALMLEQKPTLTPKKIRKIMKKTAQDMDDPFTKDFDQGYDFGTGAGFLQADLAVLETVSKGGGYQVCQDGHTIVCPLKDVLDGLKSGGLTLGKCAK